MGCSGASESLLSGSSAGAGFVWSGPSAGLS